MRVKVLDPAPAGSTLAFSPIPAPFLELSTQGLTLGLDFDLIGYPRILLVAAFRELEEPPGDCNLLLFVDDRRRPFLVAGSTLRIVDGAGESGASTTAERLRQAIRHLLACNPRIAIDRATFELLSGAPPRTLDRDVVALSSALGSALARIQPGSPDGDSSTRQ